MSADPAATPVVPPLTFDEIEKYANRCIRNEVKTVLGKFGFRPEDREDIESELRVHLISRLPLYRPDRGARASFISRVTINKLRNLIARQKAERRNAPSGPSLNQPVEDSDGTLLDLGETLDHDEYRMRSSGQARPTRENQDLEIDVARAIAHLPAELADLCTRLQSKTVPEISAETGVPKSTLKYRQLLVRKHFARAGLGSYVGSPPPFPTASR